MTDAANKWEAAKRAWDRDDGKNTVKTINLGEDLYFAGLTLVQELRDEIAALKREEAPQ